MKLCFDFDDARKTREKIQDAASERFEKADKRYKRLQTLMMTEPVFQIDHLH